MKTLYVLKRFPRLSETFILDELLRLEAAGLELGIDSLRSPEDEPTHPGLKRLAARVRHLPKIGESAQAEMVADRVRSEGFTNIHAHFATSASQVALMAGRLAGVPVTATFHAKDIFHQDYADTLAARVGGMARVVTVSEYNADHLRWVLPGVPVEVIYNGIADARQTAPQPDGPILSVARLVPKKGLDVLVRAVAELAGRGHRKPLVVVGTGPERPRLEALVSELGVADLVELTGALTRPDVDRMYATASMFVLPCRIDEHGDRDGMPTVLGEAMRRGLPVVSTDLIGIPELVRHGETGLLATPEDPRALADAIERLIDDPGWAAELAHKGSDHARQLLDPAAATASLRALFERVTR